MVVVISKEEFSCFNRALGSKSSGRFYHSAPLGWAMRTVTFKTFVKCASNFVPNAQRLVAQVRNVSWDTTPWLYCL